MPVLVAVLLLVAVELTTVIWVGYAIGAVPTLLLVLATSFLGAYLLRREGAKAYRAFAAATRAGRVPAREAADGALVLLGGVLLLLPGFVSDVVGLVLLFPPTRRLVRGPVTAFAARRMMLGGLPGAVLFGSVGRGRRTDPNVVDGEVVDDDVPPEPPKPLT
jgi:UPF0716 protein FxsA